MATYLIDYENVSKDGLNGVTRLTEKDRVIIFYSERADRMTFGLHRRLNETRATVEYKKVEVGGHNALDFQLATYLGFLVAKDSSEEYCVVSNDRGFEYLTGFWRKPLYDVTLTRTISESPQAEERRQARRNGQNGNGRNGSSNGRSGQDGRGETGGIEQPSGAGQYAGNDPASGDSEPENLAVIAVTKKPLAVVPGAEERQLDIVRDKPFKADEIETLLKAEPADEETAGEPEHAGGAADAAAKPESAAGAAETAVESDDAAGAAETAVESDDTAGAAEASIDGNAEAKSSRRSRRSRRGSRSKAQKTETAEAQDDRKEEPKPSEAKDDRKEDLQDVNKAADESSEAPAGPDGNDAAKDTADEAKAQTSASRRRRTSRSRKRVTIPFLADVKNLIGGSGLSDKDLEEVARYVERYKTKQGVNNALVRKFGNQKGGELYQGIKPLLKDKKGHVTQKAQKDSAE